MTQDEALTILKTGANVFLTGEPGSGKTYTVNRFTNYLRDSGVEPSITASTGIAATHIGGYTIHSWSGIGVLRRLTEYDLDRIANNRRVYGRVGSARVLVIDEVSMLSDKTLEMVDAVCREIRRDPRPFGGLQVIFVGDFFQLPPVQKREPETLEEGQQSFVETDDKTSFAFTSPVWTKAQPLVCYLSEQHRQEDAAFLEFLSAVRKGSVEERHKKLLRTRYAKVAEKGMTELYSHNADVDYLNNAELAKLAGTPKVFVMESRGPEPLVQTLKRGCLSPETLSLKIGARVMFTKNDLERRYVNGTTGIVSGFSKESAAPIVKTTSGREVVAEPDEWSLSDQGRVLARIIQTPLRLAWAITVHKSQGMSLDTAHMNLADAFEYGQGYVALSRVRTLAGLSLAGLNQRALEVHPKVFKHDQRFRAASDAAREKFRSLPPVELSKMHDNFLRAVGGRKGAGRKTVAKKEKGDTLSLTKELVLQGLSLQDMAKERSMTAGTIIHHLEQLKEKGLLVPAHDLMHLHPDPDRLAEVTKAFEKIYKLSTSNLKTPDVKLSPVRELLRD